MAGSCGTVRTGSRTGRPDKGVIVDPGPASGRVREPDRPTPSAFRPSVTGDAGTTASSVVNRPAGIVVDRINQYTERIIGASRSTHYGLLQAHEHALREIADCGSDGSCSASEWSRALTRAHAIFLEEVCSAYIATADGPSVTPQATDRHTVERIHALNEQIIRRTAGEGPRLLEGYRAVLQAVVDFSRDTLGANQLEWIAAVTGSYTRLLDELSSVDGGANVAVVGPP